MKREELEGLTDEQKNLVMKLYGESIQKFQKELEDVKTQLGVANEKVGTYETKISEFEKSSQNDAEWQAKFETLQKELENQKAEQQARQHEEILTNNIKNALSEKKFTSKYAEQGFINDIKTELSKVENQGKGIGEIIDVLSKDTTGIFENPNPMPNMTGMGDIESTVLSKEDFQKMGYKERIQFKQDNPELFKKYNV